MTTISWCPCTLLEMMAHKIEVPNGSIFQLMFTIIEQFLRAVLHT